ncbi:hypothetical protein EJB05_08691 [Eragrostis curvula]|uniref:Uncharacterized protein n=1 Tax=Eragrostis curvula TaxID=38414 RepID=A0A5J9W458_9POAL|nr:hypothetical protein EJB05_08691 [Eragrostis curvula]
MFARPSSSHGRRRACSSLFAPPPCPSYPAEKVGGRISMWSQLRLVSAVSLSKRPSVPESDAFTLLPNTDLPSDLDGFFLGKGWCGKASNHPALIVFLRFHVPKVFEEMQDQDIVI